MSDINQQEDIILRSEEVQEILTKPPVWIVRWGITLIFICTCILFALTFLIRYPDFVSAKVLLTTEQPTEQIISRYSGSLAEINIENGDTVNIGQRLAVIRNTAKIKDVYYLKSILDTIKFYPNGFIFPIDSISNLELGDIETAYIDFEKSYIDYKLLKDLEPYTGQLMSNRLSLGEIKKRLNDQIKQKQLLEQEYQLKKIDYHRYQQLFDEGVISQQEYQNKKIEYIQMERNVSVLAISISQMREAISSATQTLNTTHINQQEDATRFLKNLSQSLSSLKKAIRDWEYQYVLSSSIQGTVSFQGFWGINQFINSGEIVFSILPMETSNLVGKLIISSQNAGKVTIGQKVLVKLDNFPYQQYGMIVGKVRSISISPDKEGNYFVLISLPQGTMTSYRNVLPFEQELIGNAEIITEDLSVAERLFYKFRDIFKYE